MDDPIFSRYGKALEVKYLVTSLDDLKDVVDTVKHMICRRCDKADLYPLENSITLDARPIKSSLSAFILGLRLPQLILEQSTNRQINP